LSGTLTSAAQEAPDKETKMTTATAGHLTDATYDAYADRIDALFNARIITDEEHTALSYDLLDRADAYGEMGNLRIIDGLLATYEGR
jgi:hypothetical protein